MNRKIQGVVSLAMLLMLCLSFLSLVLNTLVVEASPGWDFEITFLGCDEGSYIWGEEAHIVARILNTGTETIGNDLARADFEIISCQGQVVYTDEDWCDPIPPGGEDYFYTDWTIGPEAVAGLYSVKVTVTVWEDSYQSPTHIKTKREDDLFEVWWSTCGSPTPTDTTSPSAVANLNVHEVDMSSVKLTWTAPGDDGNTGTATTYDVRYSTSLITAASWNSATQAIGEPAPKVAGSSETFTVSGLSPGVTYYFALKTADEVPNWSGLSNVVSGVVVGQPQVADWQITNWYDTFWGKLMALLLYFPVHKSPVDVVTDVSIENDDRVDKVELEVTAGDVVLGVPLERTEPGKWSRHFTVDVASYSDYVSFMGFLLKIIASHYGFSIAPMPIQIFCPDVYLNAIVVTDTAGAVCRFEQATSGAELPQKLPTLCDRIDDMLLWGLESKDVDSTMTVAAMCPVDLEVEDPDGLIFSKTTSNIPGAMYFDTDLNNDGDADYLIVVPNRKVGDYILRVVPKTGASPTDTFTLGLLLEDDEFLLLADETQINAVPSEGYTVTSTEDGFRLAASDCFIATAAYGTPMAEEVQTLRDFRDDYLLTNPVGQTLVHFYYRFSPPVANFITAHPGVKPMVMVALAPAVAMSAVVVDTTQAEKVAIVGSLVLIVLAVTIWATRRRVREDGCRST